MIEFMLATESKRSVIALEKVISDIVFIIQSSIIIIIIIIGINIVWRGEIMGEESTIHDEFN